MSEPVFMLDTSVLVHLLEGRPEHLLEQVQACDAGSLVISAIAYGEVMLGAMKADRVPVADRLLARFPLMPFDQDAAWHYARLPFKRGSFDRLIAAHALSLGLPVVTANERDFQTIPGLRIENWTK